MKKSVILGLLCLVVSGCSSPQEEESKVSDVQFIQAENPIDAGRYLITVGGCNDCHTDGYMMMDGNIPEENWLTGSSIGWHGPWGTSYPGNLRLRVQEWTEDQWVYTLNERKGLPPMPWMNVKQMSEQDMRAVYAYIKSLGPMGEHVPLALAPGVTPTTPYFSLFPQNMPETASVQ